MATSRVKTNLFLTFEIAAKWQYVCYTQRSYRLISLNQPKNIHTGQHIFRLTFLDSPSLLPSQLFEMACSCHRLHRWSVVTFCNKKFLFISTCPY